MSKAHCHCAAWHGGILGMTLLPSAATYTVCEQTGYTARISKVMEENPRIPSCIRTLERVVFSTLCHYSMCLALASAAFSHALIVAPPRIRSGRMPVVQGRKDKLQLSFDCTASSTSPKLDNHQSLLHCSSQQVQLHPAKADPSPQL